MKKFLILILLIICLCTSFSADIAYADVGEEQDVGSLVDNLDLSSIIDYFNTLKSEEQMIFNYSITDYIKAVASGEKSFELEDMLKLLMNSVGTQLNGLLGLLGLLIAICIIVSLASELNIKNASNSVKNAINLASLITMSGIVIYNIYNIINAVMIYVNEIKLMIDAVFPIFYTLFVAIGATTTAKVFSPAVSFFSSAIVQLTKSVAIPIVIVVLVLSVVGNLSDSVSLNNLHKTLCDFSKWIIRTSFFIFASFLALRGISSGVSDSISLRITKFALGKYVPVIGGYLSDGFNYVLAGSVTIKNAVGITAFVLLAIKFVPMYITVVLTSLVFKILGALAEPLGAGNMCKVFVKVDECLSVISAIVLGITFIYLIFIAGVLMSGNIIL